MKKKTRPQVIEVIKSKSEIGAIIDNATIDMFTDHLEQLRQKKLKVFHELREEIIQEE